MKTSMVEKLVKMADRAADAISENDALSKNRDSEKEKVRRKLLTDIRTVATILRQLGQDGLADQIKEALSSYGTNASAYTQAYLGAAEFDDRDWVIAADHDLNAAIDELEACLRSVRPTLELLVEDKPSEEALERSEEDGGIDEDGEHEGRGEEVVTAAETSPQQQRKEPNWSRPCSKQDVATHLGSTVGKVDRHLKEHPESVQKINRQTWRFDKNDPMFEKLT